MRTFELANEKIRDQKPREGEERRNAEKATLCPSEASMEQQHADDGHATNTVEGR
jgi:hypothetical protein